MDRISWHSQGVEGVRFGDLRIGSLLFADNVVLLASSGRDLQLSLERFAAECEAAGMRISTSRSETMVLSRKRVECSLRVGNEILLGVEPLLLRIERSQMRWLGHLVRMPPGRLPGEVFRVRPTGRRPRGRPRTRWRDYVSDLGTPRGPPGRAGGSGREQGRLGFSVKAAAPATRPPDKR